MTTEKFKKTIPQIPAIFANNLITKYYQSINHAKSQGKFICWINYGFPAGLLYAFENIFPIHPQLHAQFYAIRGKYTQMANALEGKWEVPKEICGDTKSVLGIALHENLMSLQVPDPDLLITINAACFQASQAFKVVNQYLGVPYHYIDMPALLDKQPDVKYYDYVYHQLEEMIAGIETHFKLKFKEEKLIQAIQYAFQMHIVWEDILKLFQFSPVPMDGQDLLLFFQPFTIAHLDVDNGETLNMYISLYNELYKKIEENKISNKKEERYRILWDLQPLFAKKNFIKRILMNHHAAVVMTTLMIPGLSITQTNDLAFDYPLNVEQVKRRSTELLLSMAKVNSIDQIDRYKMMKLAAQTIFTNIDFRRSITYICKKFKNLINDYRIDAVIINLNSSCTLISSIQTQVMSYINDELKRPVLLLDANPVDDRCFSPAQVKNRIEAFMENME
ncbi:MAG: 2-hydroxyacyl-CoA dehydratase [Candidatus Aminicenantes bacterium]|nr:MAG: 2-hydroxyacyl-CoA dehydratase [Candidatus Aminicenantes bacterium]